MAVVKILEAQICGKTQHQAEETTIASNCVFLMLWMSLFMSQLQSLKKVNIFMLIF